MGRGEKEISPTHQEHLGEAFCSGKVFVDLRPRGFYRPAPHPQWGELCCRKNHAPELKTLPLSHPPFCRKTENNWEEVSGLILITRELMLS